jgi:hypothetical protein
LQLDLHVTQANAGEPGGGIVGVPDHGVDEGDEIGVEGAGHEDGGADIAVAEVPGQGREDEDGDEEREGAEEDGARGGVLRLLGRGRRWGHGAHVAAGDGGWVSSISSRSSATMEREDEQSKEEEERGQEEQRR